MEATWSFVPNFDASRRESLETFDTFDKVVEALRANLRIGGAWICEGRELGPNGCYRPSVELDVDSHIFDAFFNSPGGYRAQYLSSPELGQAANGKLMHLLEPQLSAAVNEQCGQYQLSPDWTRNSFLANSAKIWPDEDELDFIEATIDLAIPKWHQRCDWVNAPLHAGLWAPLGTRLMVFGAFIDPWGNEVVARSKIRRQFDIHECGFS
jgi:hypothetical protein